MGRLSGDDPGTPTVSKAEIALIILLNWFGDRAILTILLCFCFRGMPATPDSTSNLSTRTPHPHLTALLVDDLANIHA